MFEDFNFWAVNPRGFTAFPQDVTSYPDSNTHFPVEALLHLIGAEWLTLCEYIKTRLEQINWEILFPKHFRAKTTGIDNALSKLHVWRRFVPMYREMLTETLNRVFEFPCHAMRRAAPYGEIMTPITPDMTRPYPGSRVGTFTSSNGDWIPPDLSRIATDQTSHSEVLAHPELLHRLKTTGDVPTSEKGSGGSKCGCPVHVGDKPDAQSHEGPINAFREDFKTMLDYMNEYQERIDRLTSVVTAVMSIEDSRRGLIESRNVGRLTWLATVFIPLSFVAGLFSMTTDLGSIRNTIKWYFATSVPLCVISMGVVFLLTNPTVQMYYRRAWLWLRLGSAGLGKDKIS